jgi:L-lysine exporter family protein LysE/ArgO
LFQNRIMLALSTFLSGLGLGASLIVAIGAQNLFVLRQGLLRHHVAPVVALCALADILLMVAGTAGLGRLLRVVPGLTLLLTVGGALFLFWYGLSALRRAVRPGAMAATTAGADASLGRTLRQTAAFTFLNPHVYLDTVLLLGSVAAARPPAMRAVFLLGSGSASLFWFSALGFGARLLAPVFARPAAWRVLDLLVAAVMLTLATALALRAAGALG